MIDLILMYGVTGVAVALLIILRSIFVEELSLAEIDLDQTLTMILIWPVLVLMLLLATCITIYEKVTK